MTTDAKCKKCGADVRPHLVSTEGSLCFACVTRKSGRSSRLRRLLSLELVDVGPGGNCIYCRQPFEANRIGIFLSDGKICEGCALAVKEYTGKKFSQIVEALPFEWLLKSSGRILGPFNHADVEKRLLSREVVQLDEVAKPFERWKYLRDEVAFAKSIEQLRLSGLGKTEDTSTNTHFDKGSTGEITVTQDSMHTGSVTDPTDSNLIDVQARVIPIEKGQASEPGVRSYGTTSDQSVQAEIGRQTKKYYFFSALVLVFVFLGWAGINKKYGKKVLSFDEHYRIGLEAKDVGDHLGAIKNFKQALQLRPQDIDTKLQVASLMVYFEGQTTEAQRLINSFVETESSPEILKEAYVILALAQMLDGQFTSAGEYLTKSLKYDKNFTPALINRAYIHLNQEKFSEAIQELSMIRDPVGTAANSLKSILLPYALIRSGDQRSHSADYQRAIEISGRHAKNGLELSQEAELLQLIAKFKSNKILENVSEVLDSDPELNVQFIPDLLIYPRAVDWTHFINWCEESVSQSNKVALSTALQGYCELRANRQDSAGRHFKEAVMQDPTNSLLIALNSYYLRSAGNEGAAKAEISALNSDKNFMLPKLFSARECYQKNDFKCAKEQYESILKFNPRDLSAISGLAQTYFKLKEEKKSAEYLARGLAISNRYKPLLWLKKELPNAQN